MATETWIVSGPQIIELESVTSLRSNIIAGKLNVVGHDRPDTRIEVRSVKGRPLEVKLTDTGELAVSYPFFTWDNFVEKLTSLVARDAVEVSIAVPFKTPVKLGTVSAEGFLSGLEGVCDVSTASGNIVIDDIAGDLATNSVSGDIEIRNQQGSIKAHSVSGDITASGQIPTFHADSVSGDVITDLERGSSYVKVNTVSGDVTVRRFADIGVTVNTSLVSGRMIVDGQSVASFRPGKASVDRVFGDGQVYVEVTGVSSHVTVLAHSVSESPVQPNIDLAKTVDSDQTEDER